MAKPLTLGLLGRIRYASSRKLAKLEAKKPYPIG